MTNAEYYLKEGINKEELYEKIPLIFYDGYSDNDIQRVKNFFEEKHVTLTEDEKDILRGVNKNYKYIGRKKFLGQEYLYVSYKEKGNEFTVFTPFEHLFKFIGERRRILY